MKILRLTYFACLITFSKLIIFLERQGGMTQREGHDSPSYEKFYILVLKS